MLFPTISFQNKQLQAITLSSRHPNLSNIATLPRISLKASENAAPLHPTPELQHDAPPQVSFSASYEI